MASNPPFQVEDQTDEDFFDKLVEDDFGPTMSSSSSAAAVILADRSDSDDARGFANLSIGADSGDEGRMRDEKEITDSSAVGEMALLASQVDEDSDTLLVESHPVGASNVLLSKSNGVMELKNEGPQLRAEAVSVSDSIGTSQANGSGSFGVKEVGWNSFYADCSDNFGNGGSDFFSELGNNAVGFPGNMEDCANGRVDMAMGNSQSKDVGFDNPVNNGEFYESRVDGNSVDQTPNGQDSSGNQYWENMYPGWKYDPATGQWYQADNHEQSMDSQQSNGSLTTGWGEGSNGTTEVACLRQSGQSVVSTVAETSTTESISNWKQDSQVNSGYPEHMVFDPQYPGWYYDTIAQEWRTLHSYNVPSLSTCQVHDHTSQNGHASKDAYSNDGASTMLSDNGRTGKHFSEDLGGQGQHVSWTNPSGSCSEQGANTWQSEIVAKTKTTTALSATVSGFGGNHQAESFYGSNSFINNLSTQQMPAVQSYDKASQGHLETNGMARTHNFVHNENFSWQHNATNVKQTGQMGLSDDFCGTHQPMNGSQQSLYAAQQFPYAPSSGRSPDGRPPHALVTFGFGGKLIVMKDNSHLLSSSFGTQTSGGSSISCLNLMEAVTGNDSVSSVGAGTSSYFSTLCQQSFTGPLAGGSVGSKDLNKWIDERLSSCESLGSDNRKAELLKLLLSLLKIACQHYGKLRSPFGTDTIQREPDTPESAVAKLFASAKKNGTDYSTYSALSQCLQHIPPEEKLRMTASEVQNLLVSGRKMEALQCAQEGQLWGPALIIATQLGEQFFVDTVKQMALHQLVAGTPLRTLCLLIAGQPAEVFSSNNMSDSGLAGSMIMSPQNQYGSNSMLDDWEENLAVITANRTKDDELVITHLGDCLWKERSEIIAAHICYIIAEMNFEPYSDTARLCLIGADHWKFPRTYASPEAIQRTELYEYSKVLGNSQYILLPFQPYKILYAHMLAEVGKLSGALKYCQAVLKSLKTGRVPEVDAWKQLVLSLEERIRIHQQGGYTNLAPSKLVGKLLNFFDSTAHRVVGGLPPPATTTTQGNVQVNEQHHHQVAPRVSTSQSTMAMSSLVPSASMEPIRGWAGDGNKKMMHSRSVSEPDFGRTPRQDHQVDSSKKETSNEAQGSDSGTASLSRFGRFGFGSQLLHKTVGLVLRPKSSRQAKLGETNKFYYDEKLKRWVEEGAEPPAEETALPPPPTTAAFQNGMPDFRAVKSTSEMSPTSGNPGFSTPTPENSPGMLPVPSGSNQFSARGRMGVRARYVDAFNQGRTNLASSFQSPTVSSVKPPLAANAKFFIPAMPVHTNKSTGQVIEEENPAEAENPSSADTSQPIQPATSSTMTMQRFPSMDHIRRSATTADPNSHLSEHARRTASWGGSFDGVTSPLGKSEAKPLGEVLGMPPSTFMPSPGSGDDLREVEL